MERPAANLSPADIWKQAGVKLMLVRTLILLPVSDQPMPASTGQTPTHFQMSEKGHKYSASHQTAEE